MSQLEVAASPILYWRPRFEESTNYVFNERKRADRDLHLMTPSCWRAALSRHEADVHEVCDQ